MYTCMRWTSVIGTVVRNMSNVYAYTDGVSCPPNNDDNNNNYNNNIFIITIIIVVSIRGAAVVTRNAYTLFVYLFFNTYGVNFIFNGPADIFCRSRR